MPGGTVYYIDMNRIFIFMLVVLLVPCAAFAAGCKGGASPGGESYGDAENTAADITVEANGAVFRAEISGEAADELYARLPLSLGMRELNGNEKYFYADFTLPVSPYRPGRIEAGDIMLYGDDCIVLFYESFDTSYSYTRIGKITDPDGLADALGSGNVTVVFSRA